MFVLEAKPLASVLVLFLIVLFLASAAMHVHRARGQPEAFGTMPAALWWAVVTLTTTGYGDEVPQTPLGHLLGAVVMICGIATFGLWTGILATGFAAESRRRNFIETWDLVSKVPFFQTLDPTAITEITHMLRRVEVPERTAVIRRGRVGDCMYFIAAGEVEVDVEPTPVRLGVGAFFGELALLGDSIRTANVATTKPSTLLILDLADFRKLMAHHSELARVIDAEGKAAPCARTMRRRESAERTRRTAVLTVRVIAVACHRQHAGKRIKTHRDSTKRTIPRGEASSTAPTRPTAIFRSRICRSAYFVRPRARRRASASPSAIRSSTSPRRLPSFERPGRRGGRGLRGAKSQCV